MEGNGEEDIIWPWDTAVPEQQMQRRLCSTSLEQRDEQDMVHLTPCRSPVRSALTWVIHYHDIWSKVTNHLFHLELQEGEVSERRFTGWMLHRALLSVSIHIGCVKTEEILRNTGIANGLPLLVIAEQDMNFFSSRLSGEPFNRIHNPSEMETYRTLCHFAPRLRELIHNATDAPAEPVLALTVLWSIMFISWQSWHRFISRLKLSGKYIAKDCLEISTFLSRDNALSEIMTTLSLLDTVLNSGITESDIEKAKYLFSQVVIRSIDILNSTVEMENSNKAPLCSCGRKGHNPSQCSFKMHK